MKTLVSIVLVVCILLLSVVALFMRNVFSREIEAYSYGGYLNRMRLTYYWRDKVYVDDYKGVLYFGDISKVESRNGRIFLDNSRLIFPENKNVALINSKAQKMFLSVERSYFLKDQRIPELTLLGFRIPLDKRQKSKYQQGVLDTEKLRQSDVWKAKVNDFFSQ